MSAKTKISNIVVRLSVLSLLLIGTAAYGQQQGGPADSVRISILGPTTADSVGMSYAVGTGTIRRTIQFVVRNGQYDSINAWGLQADLRFRNDSLNVETTPELVTRLGGYGQIGLPPGVEIEWAKVDTGWNTVATAGFADSARITLGLKGRVTIAGRHPIELGSSLAGLKNSGEYDSIRTGGTNSSATDKEFLDKVYIIERGSMDSTVSATNNNASNFIRVDNPDLLTQTYRGAAAERITIGWKEGWSNPPNTVTTDPAAGLISVVGYRKITDPSIPANIFVTPPRDTGRYIIHVAIAEGGVNFKGTATNSNVELADTLKITPAPLRIVYGPGATSFERAYNAKDSVEWTPASAFWKREETRLTVNDDKGNIIALEGIFASDVGDSARFSIKNVGAKFSGKDAGTGLDVTLDSIVVHYGNSSRWDQYQILWDSDAGETRVDRAGGGQSANVTISGIGVISKKTLRVTAVKHGRTYDRESGASLPFTNSPRTSVTKINQTVVISDTALGIEATLTGILGTESGVARGSFWVEGLAGSYVQNRSGSYVASADTSHLMSLFTGTISGVVGDNYRLDTYTPSTPPASVTGGITARAVKIEGVTAKDKYLAASGNTTAAEMDVSEAYITGVLPPDIVNIDLGTGANAAKGTFVNATPGLKQVWFSGFRISGESARNYSIGSTPATGQPDTAFARVFPVNPVQMITLEGQNRIDRASDSVKVIANILPATAAKWEVRWNVPGQGLLGIKRIGRGKNPTSGTTGTPGVPDTLVLVANNAGNGSVTISATATDSSATASSPFTVTLTGQRSIPSNLTALGGMDKTTEQGQAILSWGAPAGVVPGGYVVSSDNVNWVPSTGAVIGGQFTHTVKNLPRGATTRLYVGAVYDGTRGPAALIDVDIPAVRQTFGSEIVFNPPATSPVFDRTQKKVSPASLSANTYTVGGLDTWDTLYRYDPASYTVTGNESFTTFANYATAAAPVNAGKWKVTVLFRNSRFEGRRTISYDIAPKPLAAAMLTLQSPIPTYTYDGTAKQPWYTVIDGASLDLGVDFAGENAVTPAELVSVDATYARNVEAGATAAVSIKGIGNYTGTISKTFAIGRKTISIDTAASVVKDKVYDGTQEVAPESLSVAFAGLVGTDVIELGTGYTVTNSRLSAANVAAANLLVTANVALVQNGPVSKNYTLSSAPSFRKAGVIVPKDPDSSDFVYTIPTGHLFNNTSRGIGTVAWKLAQAAGSVSFTVVYRDGSVDTAVAPRGSATAVSTYPVFARVTEGASVKSNYTAKDVLLGEYVIGVPVKPTITASTLRDTTVRQGSGLTFSVTAEGSTGGVLSYQWYRDVNGTATAISGARTASYSPSTAVIGSTDQYYVQVTNTQTGVQVPDSVKSETARVTVIQPAVSLRGSDVRADGEFTYTGTPRVPDNITVTYDEKVLVNGTDYTLELTQNVNAGRALMRVIGINDYKDTASGTFVIARKALDFADLTLENWAPEYTGVALPARVIPTSGRSGLGAVTVSYSLDGTPLSGAPTDAGDYEIAVTIAQGLNFTASDTVLDLGTYSIRPKEFTAADFNFNIPPLGHKYNGRPQGIGAVTLKRAFEGVEIAVQYNGSDELPQEVDSYIVTATVTTGSKNFIPTDVLLGVYEIVDDDVSVSSNDRVIPGSGSEVVVVAPVQVVAGEFTVGPNPVAKASGKVGFFWQGKAVASGALYVFDASGNLVKKVAVADKGSSIARREIGAWTPGTVAEGTYLVKGVLVGKDGAKVKVSSVVIVR